MFINFVRKLFELLIEDEFSYIRQADNRLVFETEALSLYKDKGSILYVVTIMDAKRIDMEKYDAIVTRYSGILDGESRARVILMNVIVNDCDNRFLSTEDYLPEKKSYVFSYYVDLEKADVSVPEGQPELLGMKARAEDAAASMGEEYVNGTDLIMLEEELSKQYALPGKSENINLTLSIIAINIIMWLLTEFSGGSSDVWTLVSFGALSRNLVVNLGEYYRLFTAIFLHAGIAHLANNCLALYIFGGRVERYFGKLKLAAIFIISGVIGNVVTIFFLSNLSLGMSGAVFGLLGALLSVTYRTGRSVGDLSPYVVLLLCVSSIGFGFVNPAVNNYAHVAGFVTGVVMGRVIYRRR